MIQHIFSDINLRGCVQFARKFRIRHIRIASSSWIQSSFIDAPANVVVIHREDFTRCATSHHDTLAQSSRFCECRIEAVLDVYSERRRARALDLHETSSLWHGSMRFHSVAPCARATCALCGCTRGSTRNVVRDRGGCIEYPRFTVPAYYRL